jgi:hypothetical protein
MRGDAPWARLGHFKAIPAPVEFQPCLICIEAALNTRTSMAACCRDRSYVASAANKSCACRKHWSDRVSAPASHSSNLTPGVARYHGDNPAGWMRFGDGMTLPITAVLTIYHLPRPG